MKGVQVSLRFHYDTGLSNPRLRAKVKRATGLRSRKENDQDWAKGSVTMMGGSRRRSCAFQQRSTP